MRSYVALFGSAALTLAPTTLSAASQVTVQDSTAWKESLRRVRTTSSKFSSPAHSPITKADAASVTYSGSPYSIENLIARVEANPGRFAKYHGLHYTIILERDIRLRAMKDLECMTHNGLISNTAYHRYLKFRRSLDPERFDHFHPVLGPILAEDTRIRSLMHCASPPPEFPPGLPPPPGGISTGGGGNNFPPPPGPVITPVSVPEPSGIVLLAIGSASLLVRRMGRRKARVDEAA
jgi:hypothetical protein